MKIVVVIVGHGIPAKDFPKEKLNEFFKIKLKYESENEKFKEIFLKLDKEVRNFPRNKENDPYWYGLNELAKEISKISNFKVIPTFNEFCSPSIEEGIKEADKLNPDLIIVVPTMLIKGGTHSEKDIPEEIERISKEIKSKIIYAWPFDLKDQANFFLNQIKKFLKINT